MEAYYVKVKTEHRVLQDRIKELEVLTGTLESQLRALEEEHALCADFRCGCGLCLTQAGPALPCALSPACMQVLKAVCHMNIVHGQHCALSKLLCGWPLANYVLAWLGCRSESEAAVRQRNQLQARKDVLEEQLREQQVGKLSKLMRHMQAI